MEIKLRSNRVFRTTVDGEDIIVGGEPVEVKEKIGEYLLESFPTILEMVKTSEKEE